jgi:hypothetical protein
MSPFKVTIGAFTPRGALTPGAKTHIGKPVPSGPLGKPTLAPGTGRQAFKTPKSKKGYTGTIAGIGRSSPTIAPHPHGPGFARRAPAALGGARGSINPRTTAKPAAPKKPSIFRRIATRARLAFGT